MTEIIWRLARMDDSGDFDSSIHNAYQRSLKTELADQERGVHSLYLGFSADRLIGSGFIHWKGPRPKEALLLNPNLPELFRLGIDPEFQSCGFGTTLIGVMEQEIASHGLTAAGLGVALTNTRALSLYRRLGYIDTLVEEYIDRYRYEREDGQVVAAADKCTFLMKRF